MSVLKAAGHVTVDEVDKVIKERGKPFQMSQIYFTSGGHMQAKNIFHTPSLNRIFNANYDTYNQNVMNTIVSCLHLANKKQKAMSITIPDISLGTKTSICLLKHVSVL